MIAMYLLPVYIVINYYLYRRILKWFYICHDFFKKKYFKYILLGIYIFFAVSAIVGFLLPSGSMRRLFINIGNYWLGFLLYLFLTIMIADIIRLILKRHGKLSKSKLFSKRGYFINGIICLIIISSLCIYGVINAHKIHSTFYDININKSNYKSDMKVVLVSDLHIGYSIGIKDISNMVNLINKENADLVIIAGDIYDNNFDGIQNPDEMIRILKSIKSKNGVYAVYGNHDVNEKTLAGFTFNYNEKKISLPEMDNLLEKSNIKLLRDETVLINDSLYLIGRRDASKPGDVKSRKSIEKLIENIDKEKPIFLIDHQPRELKKISNNGIDLDLSGHTHGGQLFPLNIIMKLMWKNGNGYKKYNNMNSVVTSGVGLYGPNMRIGTKAEVVTINVHFNEVK